MLSFCFVLIGNYFVIVFYFASHTGRLLVNVHSHFVRGYCSGCARQLESCPLCRSSIDDRAVMLRS